MSTNASLELIGKFIGPDEITESVVTDETTPQGTAVVEVTFKNGKKRRYTKTALDYMLTDELSDYTTVSDKRLNKIAEEVVALVREYDVTVGDIDRLMQRIAQGIENKFNEATSLMWFGNPKEYTPGFNPMYDVSLNMAQDVIDKKAHEDGGNTAA